MKQEVVIKVSFEGRPKCRTKALKIVVAAPGVVSATVKDEDGQIVVTGEGIDSTKLVNLIRKKVGFTELVSVTPIDKKEDKEKDKPTETVMLQHPSVYTPYQFDVTHEFPPYLVRYQDPSCTIM